MVSCLEEIKTRGRYPDRGNANKRRDPENQISVTQQPGFLKKNMRWTGLIENILFLVVLNPDGRNDAAYYQKILPQSPTTRDRNHFDKSTHNRPRTMNTRSQIARYR